MNDPRDLVLAESMWRLGLLTLDELPRFAATALSKGSTSEAILQLAICSEKDTEAITQLFEKILKDGGGGAMSKIDALHSYAKDMSASILSGGISPLDGAKHIWRATINAKEQQFHEFDAFIYAASEMENRPEDEKFFENAIRDEAARWADPKTS